MASLRSMLPVVALLAVAPPLSAGWSPLGGPVPPEVELAVHPAQPRLLYARAVVSGLPEPAYLWRSRDGGATWKDLQPGLLRPSSALGLDPADPERLWVWTPEGELWRSLDAGDTWVRRFTAPPDPGAPNVLQLLAAGSRLVRVDAEIEGARVAVSRDGGASFRLGVLVPNRSVSDAFYLHPASGDLFSFDERGVEVSSDDGATWTVRGRSGRFGFIGGRLAPSDPDTMYGLLPPGRGCLARSDDGGRHWVGLVPPGLPAVNSVCDDVAVDPLDSLHVWVSALVFGPAGPAYWLLETRDGGGHWSRTLAVPAAGIVAASGGTLYTGGNRMSHGLFVSFDAGRSWQARHTGIAAGDLRPGLAAQRPPQGGAGRRVVALEDHFNADGLSVVRSDGGRDWTPSLPAASELVDAGPATLLAAGGQRVERSADGGETWSPSGAAPTSVFGLRGSAPGSPFLALDAFEDEGPVGSMALWTSDNAGLSWRRSSGGLPIECVHAASVDWCPTFAPYLVDPFDPDRRWVARAGTFPFAPRLFRSLDGGASWQPMPESLAAIGALAADPEVPGRLLAGTAGGLFFSADGGEHWLSAGAGGPGLPDGAEVRQLLRNSRSGTWYAATNAHGIFRSLDAGASWTLLAGAPDLEAPTIAVDPRQPESLLAAFAGQGLWRWTP